LIFSESTLSTSNVFNNGSLFYSHCGLGRLDHPFWRGPQAATAAAEEENMAAEIPPPLQHAT
jgi:hypothetical protein